MMLGLRQVHSPFTCPQTQAPSHDDGIVRLCVWRGHMTSGNCHGGSKLYKPVPRPPGQVVPHSSLVAGRAHLPYARRHLNGRLSCAGALKRALQRAARQIRCEPCRAFSYGKSYPYLRVCSVTSHFRVPCLSCHRDCFQCESK